jgi:hypothetical protein
LTQTGIVYSRNINEKTLTFGVSGLLYKSNLVMYDHQTESLWSQLMEKAIAGAQAGSRLVKIPSEKTTWNSLIESEPGARVLSTETGYQRNYSLDPYKGYYQAFGLWFPVGKVRTDLSAKERIMGVVLNGDAKAYPISELQKQKGTLTDRIANTPIEIRLSEKGEVLGVTDTQGNSLAPVFSFWFAWQAFHPDTAVYNR